MLEKIPKCHPITNIHIQADGCRQLLQGKGRQVIFRSDRHVFLPRTKIEYTFVCPVRVIGRCNGLFKCHPEPEGIKVVDSENFDHNNITKYLSE